MSESDFKDWKGDPIYVGTRVLHMARTSKSYAINLGVVEELVPRLNESAGEIHPAARIRIVNSSHGPERAGTLSVPVLLKHVTVIE